MSGTIRAVASAYVVLLALIALWSLWAWATERVVRRERRLIARQVRDRLNREGQGMLGTVLGYEIGGRDFAEDGRAVVAEAEPWT